MTDSIADMIIRIKNAYNARQAEVSIRYSKVKEKIASILLQENYITKFEIAGNGKEKQLVMKLLYKGKIAAIDGMERISKPGMRIYSRWTKVPKTLGGFGTTIVSTS